MATDHPTTPLSDNRIVRISRAHYEDIMARDAAQERRIAYLEALIQADGTLSKTVEGFGEVAQALANGLGRLSTPSQPPE
jgi:hypothetical protein